METFFEQYWFAVALSIGAVIWVWRTRRRMRVSLEVPPRPRPPSGTVGPVPFRAPEAENLLRGQPIDDQILTEAGERAAAACDPEDDVRGSAAYKRELVRVLVRRTARQAMEAALNAQGEQG